MEFNVFNSTSFGLLIRALLYSHTSSTYVNNTIKFLLLICLSHINLDTCAAPTQNTSSTFNFEITAQLPLSFINLGPLDILDIVQNLLICYQLKNSL